MTFDSQGIDQPSTARGQHAIAPSDQISQEVIDQAGQYTISDPKMSNDKQNVYDSVEGAQATGTIGSVLPISLPDTSGTFVFNKSSGTKDSQKLTMQLG